MRKKVMAVVVAVLAFSLIAASAATLGGINASDVGADTDVVAACNGGAGNVGVDWDTSYNAAANRYDVTGVHVSNLSANCAGEAIAVTLSNGNGSQTLEITGVVDASGEAHWVSGVVYAAEQLQRVAVVVG